MSSSVDSHAFLTRFTCLGANCEDTCCKGWSMQVDEATFTRYENKAPELIAAVTGDQNARAMKRDAGTDFCVKIDQGLCGIQNTHGASFLSDACYSYPRISRPFGKRHIMTGALSCPEIARLMLESDDAFAPAAMEAERLPRSLHNHLPAMLLESQALSVHTAFLNAALDNRTLPQHNAMRIFSVAQSLEKIAIESWPDAVPFYLEHATGRLTTPQSQPTDPFYLLQALCGLVAAAKKAHQPRLMQTIQTIEQALHVTIRWDNLAIASLPDSVHTAAIMQENWKTKWEAHLAPVLHRYLAAQISLALFPFAGFGNTLTERASVIGIRFATVRLALMSACSLSSAVPAQSDIIRIVQSLSRFLDHLSDPEFSLKIYQETGWLSESRLRALVGDM